MDAKRIKLSGGENGNGGSNIPIRTLYVSPVNVDMSDQIKCYFEQFGTVNSVEIEQMDNADTHFALVEFKIADDAAAVLSSIRMHRIDGCRVQVKAADPWLQPDHILNALNDDCLRLILLGLSQKDPTNAANVCVRFNEQARSVFSTKFKKLIFMPSSTGDKIEHSFKAFGPVVQSLNVTSRCLTQNGGYDIEILPMITQYCSTELKELTFRDFGFENQLYSIDEKFDSVLGKLERLTFIGCHLRDSLKKLVSACVDLKVLHIEGCHQNGVLSKWPEFSKLEELRLIVSPMNDNFINDIFETNSKLTKISLIDWYHRNPNSSTKIIGLIIQNNPNLHELEFKWIYANDIGIPEGIRCFSQLKSLKVLKFRLNRNSTAPLCAILAGMASIQHLKLMNGKIDTNLIEIISKMKQLKVLELSGIDGLTDKHLIVLAKGLGSQLEKLKLGYSDLTTIGLKKMLPFATKLSLLSIKSRTIIIDADDYNAMLATVQKRQEKVSLSIKLFGDGDQVRVDETVLVENRDVFHIDDKNIVRYTIDEMLLSLEMA